jgi:hypothetical protein
VRARTLPAPLSAPWVPSARRDFLFFRGYAAYAVRLSSLEASSACCELKANGSRGTQVVQATRPSWLQAVFVAVLRQVNQELHSAGSATVAVLFSAATGAPMRRPTVLGPPQPTVAPASLRASAAADDAADGSSTLTKVSPVRPRAVNIPSLITRLSAPGIRTSNAGGWIRGANDAHAACLQVVTCIVVLGVGTGLCTALRRREALGTRSATSAQYHELPLEWDNPYDDDHGVELAEFRRASP